VLLDADRWALPEDLERLSETCEVVRVGEEPLDGASLIAALQGCAGLIRLGGRTPDVSRRVIDACPDLRIVGLRSDRFGSGIDFEASEARGIIVIDADNYSSAHPVAEWDLALILLCLRNAGAVYRRMIAGTETWADAGNAEFVCGELTGRRIGLVGCGHVGRRLIELLAPFRVDMLVCDPYLSEETTAELGLRRGSLDEVLRHADILVLQTPLTPRTERMIGEQELDLLGKGRILINCSRGKVIDQEALIRRLQAGDLIAGLDVFDPEPLPADSPLRSLPNVFLTPHIAWYAPNVFHRYFRYNAEDFIRFFRGEEPLFRLTRRMVEIRNGAE
jgi:phosphoglycerate dehydrogenase-like enzyme